MCGYVYKCKYVLYMSYKKQTAATLCTNLQYRCGSGRGVSSHLSQQLTVDLVLKMGVRKTVSNYLLRKGHVEFQICKIDCLVHKMLQVSKQTPSVLFELCRWHGDKRIVHGIGSHFENRVSPFRVIEMTDWILLHDL